MHRVKVLLFATLRDYVGAKAVELEIPAGTTVCALLDLLTAKYPRLEKVRHSMIVAVNREYAAGGQTIPENAEIALFPPVSGG